MRLPFGGAVTLDSHPCVYTDAGCLGCLADPSFRFHFVNTKVLYLWSGFYICGPVNINVNLALLPWTIQ